MTQITTSDKLNAVDKDSKLIKEKKPYLPIKYKLGQLCLELWTMSSPHTNTTKVMAPLRISRILKMTPPKKYNF